MNRLLHVVRGLSQRASRAALMLDLGLRKVVSRITRRSSSDISADAMRSVRHTLLLNGVWLAFIVLLPFECLDWLVGRNAVRQLSESVFGHDFSEHCEFHTRCHWTMALGGGMAYVMALHASYARHTRFKGAKHDRNDVFVFLLIGGLLAGAIYVSIRSGNVVAQYVCELCGFALYIAQSVVVILAIRSTKAYRAHREHMIRQVGFECFVLVCCVIGFLLVMRSDAKSQMVAVAGALVPAAVAAAYRPIHDAWFYLAMSRPRPRPPHNGSPAREPSQPTPPAGSSATGTLSSSSPPKTPAPIVEMEAPERPPAPAVRPVVSSPPVDFPTSSPPTHSGMF